VNSKKDISGLVSGALQIFFSNTSDRGTTTETITIGRVTLDATSSMVGDGGSAGTALGGDSGASVGTAGSGIAVDGIADPSGLGAAIGELPAGVAGVGAQIPTQNFVPAASEFAVDGGPSLKVFYLVLAAAGAVALVSGHLVRVRS
jgi:hypothetical protein